MTDWQWRGARWWRVDLHTHTPASGDYGKGADQAQLKSRTPREWLLDFMRARVDCVAVTDHNTGAWVDWLKAALAELNVERPAGFRPLYLFPGVEIGVHNGIHVLAIFDPEKSTSDIDTLLGGVHFSGTKGDPGALTEDSFVQVVRTISSAGGIPIPAHVDAPRGLLQMKPEADPNKPMSSAISGSTLEQALSCPGLFAMEVMDPAAEKPGLYHDKNLRWTEVLGSDCHHPSGSSGQRHPGSHFTWIKMETPNLEGLRLALLGGSLSVRRSDQETANPNDHASQVLESFEVRDARYMGRANPFTIELNPWLNTIIGGRGTGKSTLVEFLRLALRREGEIPEALAEDFEKYQRVSGARDDDGLLTAASRLVVTYRKDHDRFRIQWGPGGELTPIQQERENGEWVNAEGDVAQRFPVRLYSQKQVLQLAKAPLALLRVVDDSKDVDRRSWQERCQQEETRFLSLRARAREIETGLADEPRLRGELDDVRRKLAVFEEAGHAEVLRTFQQRRRQQQAVEAWEEGWADAGDRLRQVAVELAPEPLDDSLLDLDAQEDADLRKRAKAVLERLEQLRGTLEEQARQADNLLAVWRRDRDASAWKLAVDSAMTAHVDLLERLASEGAGDPAAYGELVQRRQTIEQRLKQLAGRRKEVREIHTQADSSLSRLLEIRRDLTRARKEFLLRVLDGNPFVRIRVVPYGAREAVEAELRRLLQREDGGFEKDIGSADGAGLLGKIYAGGEDPTAIESLLADAKQEIRRIVAGQVDHNRVRDQRFVTHLGKLQPEALDRLDLWFPEDSLDVQYSTTGDGRSFRSIQEGSHGQKSAALLAFLLSYGDEPLVLDQPEDDLDNRLIYGLIVTQLRTVKRDRQLIVVTHNANLVVNGDAELVVGLVVRGGETQKECDRSLQDPSVRETVCAVLEGGREAFKQRYRRIVLESPGV